MKSRFDKLGIKQTIQLTWMDRVLQMLLAGMSANDIRQDLITFLATQKQSGGVGQRGEKTYTMAISVLATWFAPDKDMIEFRDRALNVARNLQPTEWLSLHWSVVSASYPFWFNAAVQVGRLFKLQDKVTQKQIFDRLKEQYGDRETVARNARYTVRSFVAWGVLKDSASKGCYEMCSPRFIESPGQAALLLEAGLLTMPDGRSSMVALMNNPGFFPFHIPSVTGECITQTSPAIELSRYNIDEEILRLK